MAGSSLPLATLALLLLLGATGPGVLSMAVLEDGEDAADTVLLEEMEPFPVPAYLMLSTKRQLRAPPPPPPPPGHLLAAAATTPTARWFDQYLDHFDPTDVRMWKQRWFMQEAFYKENGPAFVFIEGESVADPVWLVRGHTVEMAEAFGARIFQLEHRYYGESHPFDDMSTDNLRWLTSDQALADLAYFVEYLKAEGHIGNDTKVVGFGGSYPGCLAAWVRLKYPHLFDACVASSGPILAETDFVQYLEVVGRSIRRKAGDWCADNINQGVKRAKQLIESGASGIQTVMTTFRACSNLNLTDPLDLQSFYGSTGNAFSGAVQYNRPITGQPDLDTINQYCQKMGSAGLTLTDDEAMQKLADAILFDADVPSNQCYDYSYQATVSALSNVTYGGSYDASRLWTYQTCTEFGFYQTDDSTDTPFGDSLFPLSLFTQQCTDIFGKSFTKAEVDYGVSLTNMQYGGRDVEVDKVVFVNGDIDPWHSLSRLTDVNSDSPAIVIHGTSHCYDMQPTQATDPTNLTAARRKIQALLQSFLYDSAEDSLPFIDG